LKPLSKTDTTASARGFNSPLTLIWIVAFRGSETSCIVGHAATVQRGWRVGNRSVVGDPF